MESLMLRGFKMELGDLKKMGLIYILIDCELLNGQKHTTKHSRMLQKHLPFLTETDLLRDNFNRQSH